MGAIPLVHEALPSAFSLVIIEFIDVDSLLYIEVEGEQRSVAVQVMMSREFSSTKWQNSRLGGGRCAASSLVVMSVWRFRASTIVLRHLAAFPL